MARSAFIYDAPICGLVLRLKYSSEADVARMFAPFVLDAYGKDFAERVDIIIPVPLTPKRQRSRGYNQALLLAKGLSKEIGIAVGEPLIRVRETVAQKEMTIAERQENLKGAFRVEDKKAVKGKNVLLIDDVLTTGTTASECAKVLKKAGAREVFVLTIATTLFN
jgi:ComF family protein